MTELLVTLEDLNIIGAMAAEDHFEALVECARAALPEPMWVDIPKTRAEVSGMFTASTKSVYLQIFNNLPDYEPVTAVFGWLDRTGWALEKFQVSFGMFGPTFSANTLADAVLLSRQLVSMRSKASVVEADDTAKARVM